MGGLAWPPPGLQPTDVNDDLFKWPIAMETLYKSIPAIHTEEGKRQRERERQTGEEGEERLKDKQSEALSQREG